MSRLRVALLTVPLLFGCGQDNTQGPPISTSSSPSRESQTLSEARKGFHTSLVRKESAHKPLPVPPAELFRKVDFDSPAGKLGAYLTPSPKDGGKHPAVIWITGGDTSTIDEGCWRDSPPSNDQTARQFREAGVVLMFPSQRGGNENPGFHEGFYGEVEDVIAAARFLAREDYVDPKRLYLGGHSSGATLVLLAAECSDCFRAVFSVGPTDDLRDYPHELDELFQPFDTSNQREFELRAPGLWLNSIRTPVFVYAGGQRDGARPAVQRMAQTATNPKAQFFLIAAADHFSILAPTNRLIARKILADDGPECKISFTDAELNTLFK